jgi:hypothetical protein
MLDQLGHSGGIQMSLDQIPEQVELGGSHCGEVGVGRRLETGPVGEAGDPVQQGAAEGVILEEPVPVGP